MLSTDGRTFAVLALAILLISQAHDLGLATNPLGPALRATDDVNSPQWLEASPTRVILRSTSDWGRILFDDLNGTNSNGIKIKSVVSSGWLEGRDSDDVVYAGRKMAWPDTEYDRVVGRKGDMVAFFKGLGDFHYTEAYADLTLEINMDLARVYVWLMTGGNGTTTFEIVSRQTGGIIWRDIVVAAGETPQVRRVMTPQPFFSTARAESGIVVAWLSIVIVVIIILNFPILETVWRRMRKRPNSGASNAVRLGLSVGRSLNGCDENQ